MQIKFTGSGNDKIIIEGVRGSNSLGDIAIDDIMVLAGQNCPAQGTFENIFFIKLYCLVTVCINFMLRYLFIP